MRISFGIVKRKVASTPRIGAIASAIKKRIALLSVFLFVNNKVTVLSPSEKSCAITAIAMRRPT